MAVVIAITNQKGGVGKTTTCAAFCGGLTESGKSVLAIDLDPQGNLSFSLGADAEESYTMYDVFKGNCTVKEAIQCTDNCDVIPANILLSGCELELTGVGREYLLREALSDVMDDYDYIMIDTPPALSILTINAYTAADKLIIPMIAEILSLQGIAQLKETIGTKILSSRISTNVSLAEAPAHGISIMEYAPRSKATAEYRSLINEVTGVPMKKSQRKDSKRPVRRPSKKQ